MSPAEIIAIAKEAGFGMQMAMLDHPYCQSHAQRLYQQLERFAALVAAKEREACATACDAIYHQFIGPAFGEVRHGVAACAAAIRESGKL